MTKRKEYHTLLIRRTDDDGQQHWGIEFGDYDLSMVDEERWEYVANECELSDTRIIHTTDEQAVIDAVVSRLNKEVEE